jgi:hypothetical protein
VNRGGCGSIELRPLLFILAGVTKVSIPSGLCDIVVGAWSVNAYHALLNCKNLETLSMIIDNDLTVKVGDGVVVFDEPTLRDWAVLVDMTNKSMEEQADVLLPKVKEVRGFQYKDGSDVSIDDLRNKKFSAKFFLQLVQAWAKAITDGLREDAEAKNVETLN